MKKILLTLLLAAPAVLLCAQNVGKGGITPEMLQEIRKAQPADQNATALRNALAGTSINQLAANPVNPDASDTYFSHRVPSKGITDQHSSGRCWLFTGLNVMRAEMIREHGLGEFQFSQSYCFFYDQLEKANLFLQAVIDNAAKPMEMLATVYRILAACLGEPVQQFTWTLRDADGKPLGETKEYTPLSFYNEYIGKDLRGGYIMVMNDPSRPYHKTYTIDLDRHSYDGAQWTYLNLPMDEIKPLAIASICDSTMMYFSCDVGKFLDSKSGILSLRNYDYASLFSTDFPMNKAERISTFASASSHAMTLMAVDLDKEGRPRKWMVENSWGPTSGHHGHLIMTDEWFDEYMFRLVVDRKYVPAATLRLMEQEPVRLPAWDPLFAGEE